MDTEGFIQVSTNKRVTAAQDENAMQRPPKFQPEQRRDDRAVATDPLSNPSTPVKESIFSDPAQHPSSPLSASSPAPAERASQVNMHSPSAKSHKPAFNLLKRKRSDSTVDSQREADTRASTPLTEITTNEADARRPSGTSAAVPAAVATSNAHKKPRYTQMTLDLGQDTRRTCKQCGMNFIPSSTEDAALHKSFHNLNVSGVDMGKAFKGEARAIAHPSSSDGNEAVVMVERKMNPAIRKRVERVLETVVMQDLGALEIPVEQLWGSKPCPVSGKKFGKALAKAREKGEEEETREDSFRAFLYMEKDRCVGLCLAERIRSAQRVMAENPASREGESRAARKGPAEDGNKHAAGIRSSCVMTQCQSNTVLLGISRIWVSRSHRRKGIASILLDCARSNFFYGIEIPKEMIAFSQPTQSGGSLAKKWYGKESGWHVYESS